MKIRKLQLKNIGVFDDETINFQECPAKDKAEIHILTGENGSGKTTILMALASLFSNWVSSNTNEDTKKQLSKRFREKGVFGIEDYISEGEDFYNSQVKATLNVNDLVKVHGDATYYDSVSSYTNSSSLRNYLELSSIEETPKESLEFALFGYSGYRRIKDEPIEIGKENNENPLSQALEFVKDENSKFNVNQWLGQNLLNNALAQTKNRIDLAKHFDKKIKRFEKVINDIIADETKDNEIRFEMQSATKLVLIKNEQELDFDVLPDGLKSLISWIGDLLMRLDSLNWKDDTPIFDREIILFLDEIEVHLHPAWQRKVLPIVQKLFKNAQIFVSTHSPFVVNSVDDAWVYKLKVTDGKAKVEKPYKKTENSQSITQVLREVFDIYGLFGKEVQDNLDELGELRDKILSNGTDLEAEKEFLRIAELLAKEPSDQIKNIVRGELEQLSDIKGKKFLI
jgi:predicted ATP-binding protein involved in virulence